MLREHLAPVPLSSIEAVPEVPVSVFAMTSRIGGLAMYTLVCETAITGSASFIGRMRPAAYVRRPSHDP